METNNYEQSFWHLDDGTSISKALKDDKRKRGITLFNNLNKKYGFTNITEVNGMFEFTFNDLTWVYAPVSKKIRVKGSGKWLEYPERIIKLHIRTK